MIFLAESIAVEIEDADVAVDEAVLLLYPDYALVLVAG